ncbi:MAG: hypothetical protein LBL34_05180 [Clostridiales bacterium]|nr:hypothetical protein [Clostridiales bacterium]
MFLKGLDQSGIVNAAIYYVSGTINSPNSRDEQTTWFGEKSTSVRNYSKDFVANNIMVDIGITATVGAYASFTYKYTENVSTDMGDLGVGLVLHEWSVSLEGYVTSVSGSYVTMSKTAPPTPTPAPTPVHSPHITPPVQNLLFDGDYRLYLTNPLPAEYTTTKTLQSTLDGLVRTWINLNNPNPTINLKTQAYFNHSSWEYDYITKGTIYYDFNRIGSGYLDGGRLIVYDTSIGLCEVGWRYLRSDDSPVWLGSQLDSSDWPRDTGGQGSFVLFSGTGTMDDPHIYVLSKNVPTPTPKTQVDSSSTYTPLLPSTTTTVGDFPEA